MSCECEGQRTQTIGGRKGRKGEGVEGGERLLWTSARTLECAPARERRWERERERERDREGVRRERKLTHVRIHQLDFLRDRRRKHAFDHTVNRLDRPRARHYEERGEAIREAVHEDVGELLEQLNDREDLHTADAGGVDHAREALRAAGHERRHRPVNLVDHHADERVDVDLAPRHDGSAEPRDRRAEGVVAAKVEELRVVVFQLARDDQSVAVFFAPLHQLRQLLHAVFHRSRDTSSGFRLGVGLCQ